MRIGVSGASGQLGRVVVAELVRRGPEHQTVAISRTPEKIAASVESRPGDYDHPETLTSAYQGLDRLLIIPSHDTRPGLRDRHFVTAIDAAVEAGVKHIVLISVAAARDMEATDMYAAYWLAEQHLMSAAPRWTILRMNYFAESFAQVAAMSLGSGVLAGLAENRVAFVSRDDLAAAATGVLLSEGHSGATYNITGPAALSGMERAAILSEVSGKPCRFAVLDEAQLRGVLLGSGMPAQYIDALVSIERSFVTGSFDIVTGDVERLGGRPARTLLSVLEKQLAAGGRQ